MVIPSVRVIFDANSYSFPGSGSALNFEGLGFGVGTFSATICILSFFQTQAPILLI